MYLAKVSRVAKKLEAEEVHSEPDIKAENEDRR
jgi:hypothetical protein